jgi:hypothetical protein
MVVEHGARLSVFFAQLDEIAPLAICAPLSARDADCHAAVKSRFPARWAGALSRNYYH